VAIPLSSAAAQAQEQVRPKEAAEAVQEGNVANWLEYYQREQGQHGSGQQAPSSAPVPAAPPDPQPTHPQRR
jgi:hypothetical protein